MPLALAVLLSFVLAPVVRLVQRLHAEPASEPPALLRGRA
jgi:predicted PurR-regulated permease PerM